MDGENVVNEFPVVLGRCPDGTKEVEGDGKTPEGEFYIALKNSTSSFHLSLALSYPTPTDAERGLSEGIITPEEHDQILDAHMRVSLPPQKTALGGEIYIHGGGLKGDWTRGCVATDNTDMDAIYEFAEKGMPVTIFS